MPTDPIATEAPQTTMKIECEPICDFLCDQDGKNCDLVCNPDPNCGNEATDGVDLLVTNDPITEAPATEAPATEVLATLAPATEAQCVQSCEFVCNKKQRNCELICTCQGRSANSQAVSFYF